MVLRYLNQIVLPFMVSQYVLFAVGSIITLTSRFLPRASQFVCLPSHVVGSCSASVTTHTRLLWCILLNRYRHTNYRHFVRLWPARQRNAQRIDENRGGCAAEVQQQDSQSIEARLSVFSRSKGMQRRSFSPTVASLPYQNLVL